MKKGKELGSFFTHKPMNTRIHTSLYEPRFAHTQHKRVHLLLNHIVTFVYSLLYK